jgi:hypothetical protein
VTEPARSPSLAPAGLAFPASLGGLGRQTRIVGLAGALGPAAAFGLRKNAIWVDLFRESIPESGPGVGGEFSTVIEAVETVRRRAGPQAAFARSEFSAHPISPVSRPGIRFGAGLLGGEQEGSVSNSGRAGGDQAPSPLTPVRIARCGTPAGVSTTGVQGRDTGRLMDPPGQQVGPTSGWCGLSWRSISRMGSGRWTK